MISMTFSLLFLFTDCVLTYGHWKDNYLYLCWICSTRHIPSYAVVKNADIFRLIFKGVKITWPLPNLQRTEAYYPWASYTIFDYCQKLSPAQGKVDRKYYLAKFKMPPVTISVKPYPKKTDRSILAKNGIICISDLGRILTEPKQWNWISLQ